MYAATTSLGHMFLNKIGARGSQDIMKRGNIAVYLIRLISIGIREDGKVHSSLETASSTLRKVTVKSSSATR